MVNIKISENRKKHIKLFLVTCYYFIMQRGLNQCGNALNVCVPSFSLPSTKFIHWNPNVGGNFENWGLWKLIRS